MAANFAIHSDQPQSYFRLVLKDVKTDPGLGDREYKRQFKALKDGGAPHVPLLALEAPHDPLLALPMFDDKFDAAIDDGGLLSATGPKRKHRKKGHDDTLALTDFPIAPPLLALPEPSSVGAAVGADAVVESESSSSESVDKDKIGGTYSDWMNIGIGPDFKVLRYKPAGRPAYVQIITKCNHHPGGQCDKHRGTHFTKTHGDHEPIAYCFAWHDLGVHPMTAAEHRGRTLKPSPEAVSEWADRIADLCGAAVAKIKKYEGH